MTDVLLYILQKEKMAFKAAAKIVRVNLVPALFTTVKPK